jgi:hypothetical protein
MGQMQRRNLMGETDLKDNVATSSVYSHPLAALPSAIPVPATITPQTCSTCGSAQSPAQGPPAVPAYIYAVGKIGPRFPTPAIEKEFAQVVGREDLKGQTDPQVLHKILSDRHNRYLVRRLCWVMSVEGLDTYLLVPRDPADFDLLVESLRATPQPADLDVVIGLKGPVAPPEACNGLMVPIIIFDQIYSFDRDSLIKSIPKPEKITAKEFAPAAEELFDRIMQLTDNAGATDDNRALNYLAVRYHRIYEAVAEAFGRNESLTGVEVHPSRLSGTRKVVEVVFAFTNRNTDVVSKQYVRVDVTEEFPYLVTKLSPYFDH